MRHRPQRVRLGFLVILTLVVMAFGVINLLRTYRGSQERTNIVRTEQQVRSIAEGALQTEHEKLVRFARDELGRSGRDAAALLAQVRWLEALSALPPARRPDVDLAARSDQIQQNLARIQSGSPAVFPRGEPFLRGCYSPVDGALLPYGVLVPRGYSDSYSYPLIVTLDGDVRGPVRFQATPAYGGAISVLATPGPVSDYGNVGVEELVAVLRDVALTYNIDPQRVYLVGHERGADAAWQAAVSYPELFAGLVLFDVTRVCLAAPPEPAAGPPPIVRRAPTLQEMLAFVSVSRCPSTYVRNLAHTRVVLLQNAGGDRAALQGARALAERLRGVGASVEYLEFPLAPGQPFPDWTQQYAIAAVMSRSGTLRPEDFTYRTTAIRNRHAWWVRLDALGADPARFATVSGKLQGRVAEITTDNVSALTVVPERLPQGIGSIRVDGMQFNVPRQPLALSRRGGVWRTGEARGPLKREELSGPFSDVMRDRFIIVYGTGGDDDVRRQIAHAEAVQLSVDVARRYGLSAPVKADAEVTDEDRSRMNLVLIGGPDVNAVSAQVAGSLPVKLQDGRALVGEQSFQGQDLGLLVCYPDPANPDRMVAMLAGATPAALYQALDRLSWPSSGGYKWFDYAVFDNRTAGPDSCLALGIFDSHWRLPSASGGAAWTAVPAVREGLLPQRFPALQSLARSQDPTVFLSDVRPTAVDQPYGAVAFDRTRAGRAVRAGAQQFEKGLGVGAPSSVTYVLGGRFATFKATPVVSAAPDGAPAVVFEVLGDGDVLATSGPVKAGNGAPTPIEADVTGMTSLTLRARSERDAPAAGVDCVWAGAEVSR